MPKDIRASVGDDPEHEDLTAEIYYQEKFVAMLTQEMGYANIELELYYPPSSEKWSFPLADFLNAIELSKRRLWELRQIPPET